MASPSINLVSPATCAKGFTSVNRPSHILAKVNQRSLATVIDCSIPWKHTTKNVKKHIEREEDKERRLRFFRQRLQAIKFRSKLYVNPSAPPQNRSAITGNISPCDKPLVEKSIPSISLSPSKLSDVLTENSFLSGSFHLINLLSFFHPTNVNWPLDQMKKLTKKAQPCWGSNLGFPIIAGRTL